MTDICQVRIPFHKRNFVQAEKVYPQTQSRWQVVSVDGIAVCDHREVIAYHKLFKSMWFWSINSNPVQLDPRGTVSTYCEAIAVLAYSLLGSGAEGGREGYHCCCVDEPPKEPVKQPLKLSLITLRYMDFNSPDSPANKGKSTHLKTAKVKKLCSRETISFSITFTSQRTGWNRTGTQQISMHCQQSFSSN